MRAASKAPNAPNAYNAPNAPNAYNYISLLFKASTYPGQCEAGATPDFFGPNMRGSSHRGTWVYNGFFFVWSFGKVETLGRCSCILKPGTQHPWVYLFLVVIIGTCLVTVTPQCILFSEMVKKDSKVKLEIGDTLLRCPLPF